MTELTCSSITGFFSASRQVYYAGTFCVILCWNYCRLVHFVAHKCTFDGYFSITFMQISLNCAKVFLGGSIFKLRCIYRVRMDLDISPPRCRWD